MYISLLCTHLYHHSFHYLSITCNAFIGCYIRRMKYIFLLMYNLEVWKRFLIKKIVYDPMLNFVTVYIVETNIDHSRWSEKESFRWDYIKNIFLLLLLWSQKRVSQMDPHITNLFFISCSFYIHIFLSVSLFFFLNWFSQINNIN